MTVRKTNLLDDIALGNRKLEDLALRQLKQAAGIFLRGGQPQDALTVLLVSRQVIERRIVAIDEACERSK